jgi:hypothetical protein
MLEARADRDGGAPDAAGADRSHEPMCIARRDEAGAMPAPLRMR